MPPRPFKLIFIELVSFLTLFTLVGTMSSNFWERYLIQTELSNMKSNLQLLKDTIYNIGTAYDNLNHELKELVEIREIKSSKLIPRDSKLSTRPEYSSSNNQNIFSNKVLEDQMKLKANKSIGITASKGTDSHPHPQKELKFATQNAMTLTRNPQKSTGVNSKRENLDSHCSENNYDENNLKANNTHTKIHTCCKEAAAPNS